MLRKVLFITGTRADFGKLKPLIAGLEKQKGFEAGIFVTGMHMLPQYGNTVNEVKKCGFRNIYAYINYKNGDPMDMILANTVLGLGNYVRISRPDLIVIHGDRPETLAGAVVGALNNIPVAHIEGGEVSGTIDESIRHSVSKLSHIHFVSNKKAKRRLLQMGELPENIHVIGSPDLDLMLSKNLPRLPSVKKYYGIPYEKYSIFIYHPVTTSPSLVRDFNEVFNAILTSGKNYIVIYPNNDTGGDMIIERLRAMSAENPRLKLFPSIRFEYFLTLLKNCDFIIGNSSAGIREAPFYSVPTINIGSRQAGRFSCATILDVEPLEQKILEAVEKTGRIKRVFSDNFGDGKSVKRFIEKLKTPGFWKINIQKRFIDQY